MILLNTFSSGLKTAEYESINKKLFICLLQRKIKNKHCTDINCKFFVDVASKFVHLRSDVGSRFPQNIGIFSQFHFCSTVKIMLIFLFYLSPDDKLTNLEESCIVYKYIQRHTPPKLTQSMGLDIPAIG